MGFRHIEFELENKYGYVLISAIVHIEVEDNSFSHEFGIRESYELLLDEITCIKIDGNDTRFKQLRQANKDRLYDLAQEIVLDMDFDDYRHEEIVRAEEIRLGVD